MDLHITLKGTSPLIMHNQRLADPLDPFTKVLKGITDKRGKKTDEDHAEASRVEFEGGLYMNALGPYVPASALQQTLVTGGRMSKNGKNVERGILVLQDEVSLAYPGPRDVEGLFADSAFVFRVSAKVGQSRVMRTRPIFREWGVGFDVLLDESQLNFEDVALIADAAGSYAGIGDWRPSAPKGGPYGRFTATVEKI